MPGAEVAYEQATPMDQAEHQRILSWALDAFLAAERARTDYDTRWSRYYRLYRSYAPRRKGDWRSHVFIPIVFYVVETILPKLVAELPDFVVYPVEEEDVDPAMEMEELLDWAAERSLLHLELVKSFKSSLKFGTGILKIYHERDAIPRTEQVPVMEPIQVPVPVPVTDPETGEPMLDLDGQPMIDEQMVELGEQPTGEYEERQTEVVRYDGPKAEAVDIFNFWPAPEATSIEDARYVVQRTFRDVAYVREQVEKGIYTLPEHITLDGFITEEDEPHLKRLKDVGIEVSREPEHRAVEILEFHTNRRRLITMLNRRVIARVVDNPFEHGQKPYVRVVDHYQEHEFWGIGEIEPLEGLQDSMNALQNLRIDNVKVAMNVMFIGHPDNIADPADLQVKPGGFVRVTDKALPVQQALQPLELGDVTASAFEEVEQLERMTEKVSAVTGYTGGTDAESNNPAAKTATGVVTIAEQGNTRFALKVRLAELTGLKALAEQFGSILQQFMPEQMVLRIHGPRGAYEFRQVTQEGIQGALDYDIETQSSTITESMRRDEKLSLFQMLFEFLPPSGQMAMIEDILEVFGVKDIDRYLAPEQEAAAAPMVDPVTGEPIGAGPAELGPEPAPEPVPVA